MTSQERVLATIEGKNTDRITSDFRAEVEVFEKLQEYFRLSSIEEVLIWAKSDFRDLSFICNEGGYGGYSSFGWKDKRLDDGSFEDLWGVRRKRVNYGQGEYLDIVYQPLENARSIDEVSVYQFPDPYDIYDFSRIPEIVKEVNSSEEYFILMEGESLFDRCWALRGIEEFMMDLLSDEDAALYVINNNHRFFYEYTKLLLEKANGAVNAIGMYNDLGNQRGMMISPEIYRKYFKELQRDYIRMVKNFGVKVFYHSCGGITDIIEDLIDIGIDILDPLQLNAMNLSPAELIGNVKHRIAFHGGISIQDTLVKGTPDQVRESIQELKRNLGRYGKYIISCSHLIQMDVPIENIQVVVDEIR